MSNPNTAKTFTQCSDRQAAGQGLQTGLGFGKNFSNLKRQAGTGGPQYWQGLRKESRETARRNIITVDLLEVISAEQQARHSRQAAGGAACTHVLSTWTPAVLGTALAPGGKGAKCDCTWLQEP